MIDLTTIDRYIGTPYVNRGRELATGLDCWGLVRLLYAERGIALPSLDDAYTDARDGGAVAELIARSNEGWLPVDPPQPGDVVLFRVAGQLCHIGMLIDGRSFIHACPTARTVLVEQLDAPHWRCRRDSFWRFAPSAAAFIGQLHPLRTESIFATADAGQSIAEMLLAKGVDPDSSGSLAHVWLNGRPVPRADWERVLPRAGDRVEVRLVPRGGGGIMRSILMLAVVAVASWVTAGAGGAALLAEGGALFLGGAGASIAGAVVATAGMMLVNMLAPVRQPGQQGQGAGRQLYTLDGGGNAQNPWGPLPVVLGTHRMAPPLAAEPHTSSTGSERILHLLLLWGYGPLQIDQIRIGETPIQQFEDVELRTVTGAEPDYAERLAECLALYGRDTDEEAVGVELKKADSWIQRTTAADAATIELLFSWPGGLYGVSNSSGRLLKRDTIVDVEYRKVGTTAWLNVGGPVPAVPTKRFQLPETPDDDGTDRYRWHFLVVVDGTIRAIAGDVMTSASLSAVETSYFVNAQPVTHTAKPTLPAGAVELYRLCIKGDQIITATDVRPVGYTGLSLMTLGCVARVADGTLPARPYAIQLSRASKDAFERTIRIAVEPGQYEVRVRRVDDEQQYQGDNDNPTVETCQWSVMRSVANRRPFNPPAPMALTAIRIRASNQINGNLEPITGRVRSIGKRWSGTAWQAGKLIDNPSELFRLVLQHPANARRVPDTMLDLPTLELWAMRCRQAGYTYGTVHGQVRSIWDTLADICAAGRASPRFADGKWSVVMDWPQSVIANLITPHNSWGFRGRRTLAQLPHAFRVIFNNADKGYEQDERIVYNDGYSAANASLFEQLQLPGVTSSAQAYALARFHLAQAKLRAEEYEVSQDIEHLRVQRGSLVRVTHDVPMWGLGSALISKVISATQLKLSEFWGMDAGGLYAIRIRRSSGATVVVNVVPPLSDGYYREITLESALNPLPEDGDLVMFGLRGEESVECLVKKVSVNADRTATLTLVDYAPAVYDADSEVIPPWDSQITRPVVVDRKTITERPALLSVDSGTRALIREDSGRVAPSMLVAWKNPAKLHSSIDGIELQLRDTGDDEWRDGQILRVKAGRARWTEVREGEQYDVRARYIARTGVTGRWVTLINGHTIIGKTAKPSNVASISYTIDKTGFINFNWPDVPDLDLKGYEVRTTNAGWGTSASPRWRTSRSDLRLDVRTVGATTYYVRAYDTGWRYSAASAQVTVTLAGPGTPAQPTAKTQGNSIVLDWPDVTPGSFNLSHYVIRDNGTTIGTAKASSFTVVRDIAVGNHSYTISAVDIEGNWSAPSPARVVAVVAPSAPASPAATVTDTHATISWSKSSSRTFPIASYHIKNGTTAGSATVVETSGLSKTIELSKFGAGWSTKTVSIWAEDSEGNLSATGVNVTLTIPTPSNVTGLAYWARSAAHGLAWADVEPALRYTIKRVAATSVADAQSKWASATLVGVAADPQWVLGGQGISNSFTPGQYYMVKARNPVSGRESATAAALLITGKVSPIISAVGAGGKR